MDPQNSCVAALAPSVALFGNSVFKKLIKGHKMGPNLIGLLSWKEKEKPPRMCIQEERSRWGLLQAEERGLEETSPSDTLILDISLQNCAEVDVCVEAT